MNRNGHLIDSHVRIRRDDGPAREIDTLAREVATETTLLTLESLNETSSWFLRLENNNNNINNTIIHTSTCALMIHMVYLIITIWVLPKPIMEEKDTHTYIYIYYIRYISYTMNSESRKYYLKDKGRERKRGRKRGKGERELLSIHCRHQTRTHQFNWSHILPPRIRS